MNPSLGSIKLLEWLRKLNETFSLLDDEFIRKGYNSGIARWKRQLELVQVKGPELPCPELTPGRGSFPPDPPRGTESRLQMVSSQQRR